jgi:hypothetical protein
MDFYHATPSLNKENILKDGLKASKGISQEEGISFARSKAIALFYGLSDAGHDPSKVILFKVKENSETYKKLNEIDKSKEGFTDYGHIDITDDKQLKNLILNVDVTPNDIEPVEWTKDDLKEAGKLLNNIKITFRLNPETKKWERTTDIKNTNRKTVKEKIRENWQVYLLFGIFIVLINALINVYVTYQVNEMLKGPACRISVMSDSFSLNKSTNFKITFLITNLRNQKAIVDSIQSSCYWAPSNETQQPEKNSGEPLMPPLLTSTPPPQPYKIEELDSLPLEYRGCKSPEKAGIYTVTLNVNLNTGSCSKDLTMYII